MSEHPAKSVDIIDEHGSFLLIRTGSRFAVVERRNGRIYPMAPGEREGAPMTPEGMATLATEEGWQPENEARRLFEELSDRGDRLAQSLR
jgi:hypothetical protein